MSECLRILGAIAERMAGKALHSPDSTWEHLLLLEMHRGGEEATGTGAANGWYGSCTGTSFSRLRYWLHLIQAPTYGSGFVASEEPVCPSAPATYQPDVPGLVSEFKGGIERQLVSTIRSTGELGGIETEESGHDGRRDLDGDGYVAHSLTRRSKGRASAGARPRSLELVGLAGVGKSHLKDRLRNFLGGRSVDVVTQRVPPTNLVLHVDALRRCAPLVRYLLTRSSSNLSARVATSMYFLHYAGRELAAARSVPRVDVLVSDEGWFHKLRRLRRLVGSETSFADLPRDARETLFGADLVVFVTADPMEVCRRKLRRKGIAETEASIAKQYAESDRLGQWQEEGLSRRDLEQAAAMLGVTYVEIDYRPDFDIELELLPHLVQAGLLYEKSEGGGADLPL